jgi:hypothetical protein
MEKYTQAIDRIVELANPVMVEVGGENYVKDGYKRAVKYTEEYTSLINKQNLAEEEQAHDHRMKKAVLAFNAAEAFTGFTTLQSLCDVIKAEVSRPAVKLPYFVSVIEYNKVSVWGTYETDYSRHKVYAATADNAHFDFKTQPLEQAIITLQSRYVNGNDVDYVIDLCSRISQQSEVTSEDNGVTQTVSTNKGISLLKNERVRNRVALSPFRTFMEIEQPASEHLLRLSDDKINGVMVQLIESDGGAWKLAAKNNIAEFLRENLAELIKDGTVIVLQ